MNAFKERCIELRKKDYTLPEIAKITGRAKSSVYTHIKNIPLSTEKREFIKTNYGLRISSFSTVRKGRSKRKFKRFTKWNKALVNLISHLIFDGSIDYKGITYNNRNQSLLNKVGLSVKSIYDLEPKKYLDKVTEVRRIAYFNVALASYMKEKSVELLEKVNTLPSSLKREFLMAFFDDEGCIDFRKNRNLRRIRGYQKSMRILLLIQKLLKDFDIISDIHKPNEVVITGKENLKKFQKKINFSKGVYINGNRSNSIWKKSFEKRELLDLAIKSFKN